MTCGLPQVISICYIQYYVLGKQHARRGRYPYKTAGDTAATGRRGLALRTVRGFLCAENNIKVVYSAAAQLPPDDPCKGTALCF